MTDLLQKLQSHHVVRLCGLRASAPLSAESAAEFVQAWRLVAGESLPEGVVYRELCQPVPEWNAKVAAEMDSPIPFDFLDYTVLAPGCDPDSLAPLPDRGAAFKSVRALYHVDFHLAKDGAPAPECVMFNLFELSGPPGMQQGFLMEWPPRGNFRMRADGACSSLLHEALAPDATFAAFNRAEWRSIDDYAAGIADFEAAFPRAARKAAGGPPSGAQASGGPSGKPPVQSHLGMFRVAAFVVGQEAPPKATMRAARVHEYGPPSVLTLEEVARPEPGWGQILVRVRAVSINPLDVKMRSGDVRGIYPPWFPDTLGYSVAGVIEAIGPGVTTRRVGEEVYGINNPIMRGGYAEFVAGPESFYYPKPANLDWASAAAAPSIFATAHGALFGRANLQAGQRLLIHGGSGVVGSCAVQLAKQAGAYVLATASTANLAAVKALGADEVIDYKTQRFEDVARDLDMVLDTQGGETRERSWALLKPGGVLATLLPPMPDEATAHKYGVQAFMVHGHPRIGDIMPEMTRRLTSGELQAPEIAARFPLAEAAQAHASYEAHAPRGRIVLEVGG